MTDKNSKFMQEVSVCGSRLFVIHVPYIASLYGSLNSISTQYALYIGLQKVCAYGKDAMIYYGCSTYNYILRAIVETPHIYKWSYTSSGAGSWDPGAVLLCSCGKLGTLERKTGWYRTAISKWSRWK